MNKPMRMPTAAPQGQNRAPIQGINPSLKQSSQMGGPSNQYMSQQDYFKGVAPWGGDQSQLSMQNPMMSMGGQGGQMFPPRWGGQQGQGQNMGGIPNVQRAQNIPSYGPTSNPYMPQMQQPQPQPQQMPANPYNPYQSSQGWNQSGQFPGFRFPAY